MPWRKFKTAFRFQPLVDSDRVVQFFEPEQSYLLTKPCEAAATSAAALYDDEVIPTDEQRKAHLETVIGQDDEPKPALRKAGKTRARNN